MPILAFAGQKGGTGKSTLALSVSAELVARKKNVLLVDADPQGSARTWAAVAVEKGHPAPTTVSMGATMHRADQLPRLAASHDWTVIDCPPRSGDVQRAALMAADLVILPCGPSTFDAWALAESVELVREAQNIRPDLKAGIVVNRQNPRTSIGAGAREAFEPSGLPVLKTEIIQRIVFAEAPSSGRGVTTYAPSSPAAQDIRSLVDELEELLQQSRKKERRRAR